MGLYYDLKVYKDLYALVILLLECTKNFPREYKYSLGQEMKRDAIVLVRSLYRANKSRSKKAYLEDFLDDFEVLKFEIRICGDLGLLPREKHGEIIVLLEEIGKQITGWRKASK